MIPYKAVTGLRSGVRYVQITEGPIFREKMKRAEIVSIDVKALYPGS